MTYRAENRLIIRDLGNGRCRNRSARDSSNRGKALCEIDDGFFLRGLKINKTTRQRKTTTILFHVLKMIIFMMFFMDPRREKFVENFKRFDDDRASREGGLSNVQFRHLENQLIHLIN